MSKLEDWAALRWRLERLVRDLRADIEPEQVELLTDFVVNNEYGVAVDWLQSLITERAISLSVEQSRELDDLTRALSSASNDGNE